MTSNNESSSMVEADVVIVGGGIVGLATAYRLIQRFPRQRVIVLEKEDQVGSHQTGHNSGVLHSGIYYKPGSLKALNCRQGKQAMEAFCREEEIPFDICGKVIVAVVDQELPQLETILKRGGQNGVRCELIGRERLAELEPHAAGIRAIHVPETGIVDFRQVSERLRERLRMHDGDVITGMRVSEIRTAGDHVELIASGTTYRARFAVNCAGLYCDRVMRMAGQQPQAQIVPFRGEYYALKPEAKHLCRDLIYPVPNPNFPFLGVHFTRMIDGSVECGPNAVLAFAREGYRKTDINIGDLCESIGYVGFRRLAFRYWRMGCGELWRSFNKRAFVHALQRMIPEVQSRDLVAARAGVRAQAIRPDGQMVDDFLIQTTDRIVHVGNAPSPAATSSLNIGKLVVDKLAEQMSD